MLLDCDAHACNRAIHACVLISIAMCSVLDEVDVPPDVGINKVRRPFELPRVRDAILC